MYKYIIKKIKEQDDVREFIFAPEGDSIQNHVCGQFVTLYIFDDVENNKVWGINRPYSIASPPEEFPNIRLEIKLQGEFTHRLWKLKEGEIVGIDGPFGMHDLSSESDKPIAMFAGGIGITPMLCYLRHIAFVKSDRKIILFYSSRTLLSNIDYEELKRVGQENHNIKIIFIFTRDSNAPGEHERINKEMIGNYITNPKEYIYFICGSKGFSKSIEGTLFSLGIDEANITSEAW